MFNIVVGHTYDPDTARQEDLIARFVVPHLIEVDGAIHLNRQSSCMTVEVEDEPIHNLLAPESVPTSLPSSDARPQLTFGRRHLGSQLPRRSQLLA